MSFFKSKNVGNLTTTRSRFGWKNREHLHNNHSLNLKGKNMHKDTPGGHSWLSVFKIFKMMCPKCTRRNSMLPSSFKREKRWKNADMEMNLFSIARIPMPCRQEYKNVFHFPDTNLKCRQEIKLFFPSRIPIQCRQ